MSVLCIFVHTVCQAQELNQKLRYVNEHQKCELEVCGRELRECRLELVGVRVVTAGRVGSGERGVAKEGSGRSSEQELKMVSTHINFTIIQWNLRIKDTWGPEQVSFIQRCPLFGG